MARLPQLASIAILAAASAGAAAACGARTGALELGTASNLSREAADLIDGGGKSGSDTGILKIACVRAAAATKAGPAYLELVLDGSGSMKDDEKWSAASSALVRTFDQYLKSQDYDAAMGLIVFSDILDSTGLGPYPGTADVPLSFVDQAQRDVLAARLTNTRPAGGTPTLAAIEGAYDVLRAFQPAAPLRLGGRKIAVLLTDGLPSGGDEGELAVRSRVEAELATRGVRTFVIGIGEFPSENLRDPNIPFLNGLAKAGGTASSPGCTASTTDIRSLCHFQIAPAHRSADAIADDMARALTEIRLRAGAVCEFTLSGDLAMLDPNATRVTLRDADGNDEEIAHDATNGWEYDDPGAPHAVLLRGASCRKVTADTKLEPQLTLACR